MFSEHYPNDYIIRVSNFIRLVDENHIRFDPPRGHMKSVLKEEWNIVGKIYNSKLNYCQVVTIALSFSVSITINIVTIISNRRIRTIIFTISSDFCPDDVIGSSPDVTWNSNWPTWKSFNSFPGRLLENPAGPHGKPCLSHWIWMDLIRRKFIYKRYLLRDLRWWSRCSCRKRRGCYILENPSEYLGVKIGSTWKIEKAALKKQKII